MFLLVRLPSRVVLLLLAFWRVRLEGSFLFVFCFCCLPLAFFGAWTFAGLFTSLGWLSYGALPPAMGCFTVGPIPPCFTAAAAAPCFLGCLFWGRSDQSSHTILFSRFSVVRCVTARLELSHYVTARCLHFRQVNQDEKVKEMVEKMQTLRNAAKILKGLDRTIKTVKETDV